MSVYDCLYLVYASICQYIHIHYRRSPSQLTTVQHGHQRRIANPRLTGNIEITVCQRNTVHSILVSRLGLLFNVVRIPMRLNFLQQGLICLEISCSCMETQNAHEYVLVVGQIRHLLDVIDMRMLATKSYTYSVCTNVNRVYTSIYCVYTGIYPYILILNTNILSIYLQILCLD